MKVFSKKLLMGAQSSVNYFYYKKLMVSPTKSLGGQLVTASTSPLF